MAGLSWTALGLQLQDVGSGLAVVQRFRDSASNLDPKPETSIPHLRQQALSTIFYPGSSGLGFRAAATHPKTGKPPQPSRVWGFRLVRVRKASYGASPDIATDTDVSASFKPETLNRGRLGRFYFLHVGVAACGCRLLCRWHFRFGA